METKPLTSESARRRITLLLLLTLATSALTLHGQQAAYDAFRRAELLAQSPVQSDLLQALHLFEEVAQDATAGSLATTARAEAGILKERLARPPAAAATAHSPALTSALRASPVPRFPLGLDLYRPIPESNPLSADKIALGKRLFHERRLSRDRTMSCAACHDPKKAFANNLTVGEGVGRARGTRNVPAILNRAWGTSFFWDGRVTSLEQQAIQPLLNTDELAMTPDAVLAVVRSREYQADFIRAFGHDAALEDVGRAIASYVRTIVAGDAPYDRYAAGKQNALSPEMRRGLAVFRGKGGCTQCHVGPTFSDEQFHNTGIAWRTGRLTDEGRAKVTQKAADRGAFKTPTLREVVKTAPYMHDGTLATLQAVVDYYDEGGAKNPGLDTALRPLRLTAADKQDLVAFLRSLTGTIRDGR